MRIHHAAMHLLLASLGLAACTFLQESNFREGTSKDLEVTPESALVCPSGFIRAPSNSSVGVFSDFCVMQFEAKNVSGVPSSQALGLPWVNINMVDAHSACASLGAGYALITNPEWIAIARSIEATAANWSGGAVYAGVLNRGHSDAIPGTLLSVSSVADSYDQTTNNASQPIGTGWEQMRTHLLANGNQIWDLSGNAMEWVNWRISSNLELISTSKAYVGGMDGGPVPSIRDISTVNMSTALMPATSYFPTNTSLTNGSGIGFYFAGYDASGGAAIRGGFRADPNSGIFSLDLSNSTNYSQPELGFRCVYRP